MRTYSIRLRRGHENACILYLLEDLDIEYSNGRTHVGTRALTLTCSAEDAEKISRLPELVITEDEAGRVPRPSDLLHPS